MLPAKQPKPSGACNVCLSMTRQRANVNHRCDHVVYGRRCSGTYKSSMAQLWDACESCAGIGKVGSRVCGECSGFGWKAYG
jgi:hypothetical protein